MRQTRAVPCLHGILGDADWLATLQEAGLLGEHGPVLLQPLGLSAPVVLHTQQRQQADDDRQRHSDECHRPLQRAGE